MPGSAPFLNGIPFRALSVYGSAVDRELHGSGLALAGSLLVTSPGPPAVTFNPAEVQTGGSAFVSGSGLRSSAPSATVLLVNAAATSQVEEVFGQVTLAGGAFAGAQLTIPTDLAAGLYRLQAGDGSVTATSASMLTVIRPAAAPVCLRLSPDPATLAPGDEPVTLRLLIESDDRQVDTARVWLRFDPDVLRVLDDDTGAAGTQITPGGAFATVLENDVDNTAGTVAFAAGRGVNEAPLVGAGELATIRVEAQGTVTGSATTALTFDDAAIEVVFDGATLPFTASDATIELITQRLVFTQWPIRASHGYASRFQPAVALQDTQGVTITTASGAVVSLTVRSTVAGASGTLVCDQTVGGVATAQLTHGIATFSGCRIDTSGAGYVLEARVADAGTAVSPAFNVHWAGDASGNCRVSAVDYSIVVTHFGRNSTQAGWASGSPPPWRADLSGDDRVSAIDYSLVVTWFGTETTACAGPSGPSGP